MRTLAKPLPLLLGASFTAFIVGVAAPACSGNPLGQDPCDACEEGQDAYVCDVPSSNNTVCAWDYPQAYGLCGGEPVAMTECSQSTGGASQYPNWDPDSYIYYDRNAGQYVVDAQLLEDVAADAAVLFVADQAKLVAESGGYYKLYNVGRDDMARHLGFQTGDKIMTVNGSYVLQTWADYAEAIVDLRTASAFSVVVYRGGNYVTLYYRVE